YDDGLAHCLGRDRAAAWACLSPAAEREANDARIWYIKALAERQLGDHEAARDSARRAAAVELLNGAQRAEIAAALERVQGEGRQFLRQGRSDLTVEKARQIATAPVKKKAYAPGFFGD